MIHPDDIVTIVPDRWRHKGESWIKLVGLRGQRARVLRVDDDRADVLIDEREIIMLYLDDLRPGKLIKCHACHGDGYLPRRGVNHLIAARQWKLCDECLGNGYVYHSKEIT